MKIRFLYMLVLLLLPLSISAQKQRKSVRVQPTPEELERKAQIERMTMATEKVMFIDSITVEKEDFLRHFQLSPEAGRIERYQTYFKTNRQSNAFVYVNEIGNKCLLSQENNEGVINLYFSEIIANKWTRPTRLRGINDEHSFSRVNYPFMMGDGETLYFAAEGADGVGGYDIYVTTYDEEDGRFLKPVNIGMPFNSDANDYMYVIDEYSNLGWFVSDRNQPDSLVCIYIFEPSKVRQTYSADDYTPEQIADFASIASITNTWDDEQRLGQAQARLQMVVNRKNQKITGKEFTFVINDDVIYHQLSDFKAKDNATRFQQLMSLIARQQALDKALNRARDYFSAATNDEREDLRPEILASEQKQYELSVEIHLQEKKIRNEENIFLTKNQ